MQHVTTGTTSDGPRAGNTSDAEYDALRARMGKRFSFIVDYGAALFTTDAIGLWDAYLASFPEQSRQYHNCSECRHFIERFGGLVTLDESGIATPAVWNVEDSDETHGDAIAALAKIVRRAKVTGVFLSSNLVLGTPETGEWTHFFVTLPASMKFRHGTMNAGQAMAEKSEDFKNVMRALGEFTAPMLATAMTLLNADALYSAEKVIGPAKWLSDLHAATTAGTNRANVVWRAIATAPAGFCHPRSSMVGTLLEDIAAGKNFDEVARSFKAKMHPLKYQRPQAAPTAGAIVQAEKVIAQLDAAGSLDRRFARLDECETVWRPTQPKGAPGRGGVFGHLKAKGAFAAVVGMDIPAQTMTWAKFSQTVLPNVTALEIMVPYSGNFVGLLTAAHADAPPILQWDLEERRNPVSLYVYHPSSRAEQWNLDSGWAPVTGVTLRPSQWYGGNFPHHGTGAVFIIAGAVDRNENSGNALFPSTLKSELHGVRSVIEAYSKEAQVGGRESASACGLLLGKEGVRLRVRDGAGNSVEYLIDRLD